MRVVDRDGSRVQSQRAARVAEPPPLAHRLAGCGVGQRSGRRPAAQPRLVHRQDPGDRRLLQHELADHDRPRGGAGTAPRQVAGVRSRTSAGRRPPAARRTALILRSSHGAPPWTRRVRRLPCAPWTATRCSTRSDRCRQRSTGGDAPWPQCSRPRRLVRLDRASTASIGANAAPSPNSSGTTTPAPTTSGTPTPAADPDANEDQAAAKPKPATTSRRPGRDLGDQHASATVPRCPSAPPSSSPCRTDHTVYAPRCPAAASPLTVEQRRHYSVHRRRRHRRPRASWSPPARTASGPRATAPSTTPNVAGLQGQAGRRLLPRLEPVQRSSAIGCAATGTEARPGTYKVVGKVGGLTSRGRGLPAALIPPDRHSSTGRARSTLLAEASACWRASALRCLDRG